MDSKELDQYLDLQREIERLEIRLEDLKNKKVVDRVEGSNPNFPYQKISLTIEGFGNDEKIRQTEKILRKRIEIAKKKKIEIENFISKIPDSRTRMIFEDRYIFKKPWLEISNNLYSRHESYARNIHDRYLKNVED